MSSILFEISSSESFSVLIESIVLLPETKSRFPKINAQMTISLTAFALAPGVLKTTTPFSEHSEILMLFVPAPAREIANNDLGISSPSVESFLKLFLVIH